MYASTDWRSCSAGSSTSPSNAVPTRRCPTLLPPCLLTSAPDRAARRAGQGRPKNVGSLSHLSSDACHLTPHCLGNHSHASLIGLAGQPGRRTHQTFSHSTTDLAMADTVA